jgi:hypothetical protein
MSYKRHIHPEELMNPDIVSEIVILGSLLLVVVTLLFAMCEAYLSTLTR